MVNNNTLSDDDKQDILESYYPEQLNASYITIQKILKHDPTTTQVVSRFRYDYPELYQYIEESIQLMKE